MYAWYYDVMYHVINIAIALWIVPYPPENKSPFDNKPLPLFDCQVFAQVILSRL